MLVGVADTHTVIWYIYADKLLSVTAKAFLDEAYAKGNQIGFSSITLAEIVYLEEKGRIPLRTLDEFLELVDMSGSRFVELPFDRHVAAHMAQVPRTTVPDLPDRIVATTALLLGVPIITRDSKIVASGIATIW
jgi:PIN domain nuclease of toxin-antitoxin system